MAMNNAVLRSHLMIDQGTLTFSIESRILRELGERLVKQPEVGVVELIKNAYDADALECTVEYDPQNSIIVSDDGHGMTLDRFVNGWMRIGTSLKGLLTISEKYSRRITGEKGIGSLCCTFSWPSAAPRVSCQRPQKGCQNSIGCGLRLAQL